MAPLPFTKNDAPCTHIDEDSFWYFAPSRRRNRFGGAGAGFAVTFPGTAYDEHDGDSVEEEFRPSRRTGSRRRETKRGKHGKNQPLYRLHGVDRVISNALLSTRIFTNDERGRSK